MEQQQEGQQVHIDAEQEALARRYDWKRVHASKAWSPRAVGAELVGFYGGRTTRNGAYGQYDVVLVHVPKRGSYMVSGCQILQLADSALLEPGDPMRIVFMGYEPLANDKKMRVLELYVSERAKEAEIPVEHAEPQ